MLSDSLRKGKRGKDITQVVCETVEPIDLPIFERAWNKLAQRHEILRTSIAWEGLREPQQRVHLNIHVPVRAEDWSGISDAEQKLRLESFLTQERRQGFDLSIAPLFRVGCFALGANRYFITFTYHHILLDARSLGILFGDVFEIYENEKSGESAPVAEVASYRRVFEWIQANDPRKSEAFWREM
ncbi:MAG TPA: condensation domain-containing protein, partial [Verrucomicrobiae bacterium]